MNDVTMALINWNQLHQTINKLSKQDTRGTDKGTRAKEKNRYIYFFTSGQGNESYNLIGSQRDPNFPISDHGHSNACVCSFFVSLFSFESLEKINELFTGLRSVRIVKNCDLGLENAALGLRLKVGPYSEKL